MKFAIKIISFLFLSISLVAEDDFKELKFNSNYNTNDLPVIVCLHKDELLKYQSYRNVFDKVNALSNNPRNNAVKNIVTAQDVFLGIDIKDDQNRLVIMGGEPSDYFQKFSSYTIDSNQINFFDIEKKSSIISMVCKNDDIFTAIVDIKKLTSILTPDIIQEKIERDFIIGYSERGLQLQEKWSIPMTYGKVRHSNFDYDWIPPDAVLAFSMNDPGLVLENIYKYLNLNKSASLKALTTMLSINGKDFIQGISENIRYAKGYVVVKLNKESPDGLERSFVIRLYMDEKYTPFYATAINTLSYGIIKPDVGKGFITIHNNNFDDFKKYEEENNPVMKYFKSIQSTGKYNTVIAYDADIVGSLSAFSSFDFETADFIHKNPSKEICSSTLEQSGDRLFYKGFGRLGGVIGHCGLYPKKIIDALTSVLGNAIPVE